MNKEVFRKTIENVRNHRGIKLVATGTRRNYLVSAPHYHSAKFFTEHLLAIEIKKITNDNNKKQIFINKWINLSM